MAVEMSLRKEDRIKDVPYPVDLRLDSLGHGFTNMKGNPDLVSGIFEAKDMYGIQSALKKINISDSPFFSIGCEKAFTKIGEMAYVGKGYIEFSYNFEPVARYSNYAKIYDAFLNSKELKSLSGNIHFEWVIAPVRLTDKQACIETCALWVTTDTQNTENLARASLNKCFKAFGNFVGLLRIKTDGLTPIF